MGKFLILSESGSGAGLALRLSTEGHESKMKIFDSDYDGLGGGLIDGADEYSTGQIVIADCVGFGHVLESYRDAGIPIFGGGIFADRLEADRGFAEEVMHKSGIEVPESENAATWEEAAKLVKKYADKSGKVVIKPEGALSGLVPSYVASDEKDALSMLKIMEKNASNEVNLTIQEFIEGVAVSTEGWFNGHDWAEGMFNHTIERKQFLAGDIGPSTGCTGNVVWPCDSKDPIVKQTLLLLTDVLRKHLYVGPIDVNCVVNKEGVYGLEFTPRFGYDAFPTLLYGLCDFNFGAFVGELVLGADCDASLSPGFAAGVRLGLPPWPSEKFHGEVGVPIRGIDEENKQYFYPYEVALVDGELRSSKGFGVLGVMNYEGSSVGEAFACVYKQIAKLQVPNLQYRNDLCEACLEDYRELRTYVSDYEREWIGVDLDGTLAKYSKWSDEVGEPVPKMVQKVKRWIAEGKEVRILTARGTIGSMSERYEQLMKIYEFIEDNIGSPLEVTDKKDPYMIRLYDDRVRQVEANEGVLVASAN